MSMSVESVEYGTIKKLRMIKYDTYSAAKKFIWMFYNLYHYLIYLG